MISQFTTHQRTKQMFKSIAVIAALATTPATAGDVKQTCKQYGGLSEQVMIARQNGVPLSTLMDVVTNEMFEPLLIHAYQLPRYSTQSMQRRSIEDFRNAAETACFNGLM